MSTDLVDIQEQLRKELEIQKANLPGATAGRIKTKGKKFTLPGGNPTEGPLDVIIVGWRNTNNYFEGTYNSNNPQPAVCHAIGAVGEDMTPSKASSKPQNDTCLGCPKNEWGSAGNGSKGKACKNGIRLAVVPPNPDAGMTPLLLDVTPTGIKAFTNYVNALQAKGILPIQMITEVNFDEHVDYPTLTFKADKMHEHLATAFGIKEMANSVFADQ